MLAYLPAVAPVIAILNGVIAVYVAQFKPDEMRAKVILLGLAIFFGAFAAGATIWSQHAILQKQQEDKDKRETYRLRIAEYIISSAQVLQVLQNSAIPQQQAESNADRWYNEAATYVLTIGPDYLARFQNTTGLPPISPTGINDQQRINYWLGIYYRNMRLEQFASEFSR